MCSEKKCFACKGSGKVLNPNSNIKAICGNCDGTGHSQPATPPLPTLEKCQGCGREIHPSWPAFYTKRGAVCMMCEGVSIEVFRVSLPGDKGGYIDKEMPSDFFANMDVGDAFTVHRESMRLLQYLNLPEFGGF